MKYERALFGMKVSDATSLGSCIRHTQVLTTLACVVHRRGSLEYAHPTSPTAPPPRLGAACRGT